MADGATLRGRSTSLTRELLREIAIETASTHPAIRLRWRRTGFALASTLLSDLPSHAVLLEAPSALLGGLVGGHQSLPQAPSIWPRHKPATKPTVSPLRTSAQQASSILRDKLRVSCMSVQLREGAQAWRVFRFRQPELRTERRVKQGVFTIASASVRVTIEGCISAIRPGCRQMDRYRHRDLALAPLRDLLPSRLARGRAVAPVVHARRGDLHRERRFFLRVLRESLRNVRRERLGPGHADEY